MPLYRISDTVTHAKILYYKETCRSDIGCRRNSSKHSFRHLRVSPTTNAARPTATTASGIGV